jgi:hypothetical protein
MSWMWMWIPTPRGIVCIFGYIIIFAAFFLGRRAVLILLTVGMEASMFARLELTLRFFFFF